MGGGIFALRRPRPYSRHCGEGDATHAALTIIYANAGMPLRAYRKPSVCLVGWCDYQWEGRSDAACRVVIKNLPWGLLQKKIPCLSIGEIGYCALGRGDAERSECPP